MPYKSAEDRRRYSRESKARWLAKNKVNLAEKIREQRRRSYEKCRPTMKARAVRAGVVVETVDYGLILAQWDGNCGICHLVVAEDERVHWDHIIPLSRGGSHTESNLQRVHAVCNLRKGTKIAA